LQFGGSSPEIMLFSIISPFTVLLESTTMGKFSRKME
jgi:hypothetical protein